MGKLVFRVASDWLEVVRLRTEIEKLKQTLLSIDSTQSPDTFKKLNVQLGESTKKMNILISDAAKAGATMENDFKKGIYDGEKAVNSLSEEIIKQKNIIRETQNDVSMLTEQYKKLGKYDPKRQSLSDELNRAKAALGEQKYALGELQSQQALVRLSTKALKDEYALFKDESKAVITTNDGVGVSFKKMLATIGGIAMLKQVASNVVSTAGMFQKYESVLTNALDGSSDKAKAYLSDINSFAAKTNFQLDELTDDFIKFVNRGVTPSMDAMKRMGDFTNTVAKPFDQLTEAILDINNPERWKEFGVRVQTEGNKVKLSFRDMTVECDRTVESVMKAVEQFGSMKGVEGSTEAISKTIEGQMSNLEDTITTALAEIGLANQDLISGSISAVDTIVKNYDIIGKSVLALIEIYGVYRAGLLINTIVEQGSVKSIWAKITATKAATIAQAAYNKVLAMNPYVAVGMAVVSLGIAMWTLADHTSEAEKAQKRFNKKQEEAAKQEQEHKQKIDSLVESSRDIALSDLQRGQSLAELRKEYPKIFEKYDVETIKLADILKLKQQIAEEDAKRVGEKKAKELSDIEGEIKYYENLLKSLSGQQGIDGYVKKLKQLRLDRDTILQDRGRGISEQFISSLKDIDISEFGRYISELERRIKGKGEDGTVKLRLPIDIKGTLSDEAIYGVKDIKTLIETTKAAKKTKEEAAKAEKKSSAEWLASYKKAYEDADKAYKDFLSSKKVMSDAARDKELKRLKGLRDTAEATYKSKGGSLTTDKKEESQAESIRQQQEKYALLLDKQALDRKRQAEDLENQLSQSKIDAMSDGFDKEKEQRDLNNKKEIQALQRQKKDYIRTIIQAEKEKFDAEEELNAKQTKGYKKRTFNSSGVAVDTSKHDKIIENTKTKQVLNEWEQREASMNEYLLEYGTFSQKKEAIDKKYRDAIDKEADLGKKNILQKEWEEAIQGIDMSELKQSMDWEQVFGNLDKVSTSTLKKMKANLKDFISNQKDLSPENLKELVDAIERIDDKVSERNPFEAMSVSFKSLKSATDTQREAQEAYNKALKEGTDEEQKNAKATLEGAKNNKQKALYEANIALHKGVDEIGQYVEAGNQVIGIMETLGIKTPEWLEGTMSGFGEMLNGLEKIDLMKPMSIVTGGLQTVKGALTSIISLGGLIPGFGGADYSQYNKMVAQYEQLSTIWDELIDKKKEYIDISYGSEALKAGQEALDIIDKSQQAQRNLARARVSSGASAGSHSIAYRQNKGLGGYAPELYKYVSQNGNYNDITSALLGASEEQLKKVREQMPEMWAGLDGDFREHLDNIISGAEQTKEVLERMKEAVTGMSFDEFRSGYVDLLSDLDSTNEYFADNFEKYLQNAIFESLLANKYKDQIQDLYDTWSEYGKDGLSSDEVQKLRDMQKQLTESMIAERDKLMADYGWESDSESSSQSSTSRGFQAMSQDTGEELNGRFTALQIAGEEIRNQNIAQSQSLNLLTAKADTILSVNTETRNIADDTRDLIAQSYLELVQISENTGAIVKPIQQMQKDMAEVKKNTAGLAI